MSIFRLKDLKRIVEDMDNDNIEMVDIEMYQRDEIEGEIIGATVEFTGIGDDNEEMDYGGIEEVIDGIS